MRRRTSDKHASHSGRRAPGSVEAEVMTTLWSAPAPMTVGDVAAALDMGLSYKTVLTILSRLHAKGLVEREAAGRGHAYRPTRDAAESAAEQMSAALHRGAEPSMVLQRFVDGLDSTELAALRDLLATPES